MLKNWVVCSLGVVLLACGGGGDDDDDNGGSSTPIATTPLAGKVGGKAWTFGSADTDSFLSDEQTFWVTAYGETVTACSGGFSNLPELLLNVPTKTGDHPLGLSLTATFYNPDTSDNLVATNGHIRVDTITSTAIAGGAFIEYDAQNTVNGLFTASVCP